jgi:hypothetical protein
VNYVSHTHRALIVGVVSLMLIALSTSFAGIASAQPATPPAPVPASSPDSKFSAFVGTWRANATQLEVRPDTSATMTFGPGDFGSATPIELTLKFITTTYGGPVVSATVQVVASNSPRSFPVGATETLSLNAGDGLISPTLNGRFWVKLCGPNTTNASDWCGATLPRSVPASGAVGPRIVPDAVAPGHELDYLYLFVGEWRAHENSLEVRPDGTATWTSAPIGGGDAPPSSTELQFVLTNGGEINALATVQVVANSDTISLLQVGETGTFILRRMDNVIVPTFGNDDFLPFCATDSYPNPSCGA